MPDEWLHLTALPGTNHTKYIFVDIISDLQFFGEVTLVMYNNIKLGDLYLLLGKYFQFKAYRFFIIIILHVK